ncbi:MAG TPA: SPFH domain-containing protein [Parafilimonas sp.]|nr:SPFH domain-containing protein [Parafilimonas sp.]
MDLIQYWWVLLVILALVMYKFILRVFFGMVIVPDDKIGLVIKNFVLIGKNRELKDNRIIATNGEAGMQAQTLAPGLYWAYWIWQYKIRMEAFIIIPEAQLGLIKAKDGDPLNAGRILALPVECDKFQDAVKFLANKGQKGPQAAFLTPGSYRINTFLFELQLAPVTVIEKEEVGIVTTLDGEPLDQDQIAGRSVPDHKNYQDPVKFLSGGGQKGRQEDVILAGAYYLNPWFAVVEQVPMLHIPIGNVGVVNSFVGVPGKDISGVEFAHGNIVEKGRRGVWNVPLDPGKYAINTYTHTVEIVPTTNLVLNWATGRSESHQLDKNLSTITVRSSDGFTFNLDVSQIIHIPSTEAPKVIARFGNMINLVSQVLEPTIGNYFRNSAQTSDVIDFLKNRTARQNDAKEHIKRTLDEYNVKAVDTLIGDITPPNELMKTLTDRKIAEQETLTLQTQKLAEDTRKQFESAKALATIQPEVVKSNQQVEIKKNLANAKIEEARGDGESKTINAKADAEVTKVTGDADGGKILAIGNAEAEVTKRKTEAMGTKEYAQVQIAHYLAENKIKIVPDVLVSDGQGEGGMVSALIGSELFKSLKNKNAGEPEKK